MVTKKPTEQKRAYNCFPKGEPVVVGSSILTAVAFARVSGKSGSGFLSQTMSTSVQSSLYPCLRIESRMSGRTTASCLKMSSPHWPALTACCLSCGQRSVTHKKAAVHVCVYSVSSAHISLLCVLGLVVVTEGKKALSGIRSYLFLLSSPFHECGLFLGNFKE